MNPTETYHLQCQQDLIKEDPEQLIALKKLQKVYDALLIEYKKRKSWQGIFHKPQWVQGLYLWGGVGIGKTLLMDCFYQSLPSRVDRPITKNRNGNCK
jgi:cell division protein ZapE